MKSLAIALIGVSLLTASCGGGGDDAEAVSARDTTGSTTVTQSTASVATTAPSTVTTATLATTTTALGLNEEAVFASTLPRSTVFGGIKVTIDSARFTNASLFDLGGQGTPSVGKDRLFVLEGTVTNQLPHDGSLAAGQAPPMTLEIDGVVIAPQRTSVPSGIAAQARSEFWAAFTGVVAKDLAGARLVVGGEGYEHAIVALDGPEVLVPAPSVVTLGASMEVDDEPGAKSKGCTNRIAVVAEQARVGLDAEKEQKSILTVPYAFVNRVREGYRFMTIDLRVTARSGACGGVNVNGEQARLWVDESPLQPIWYPNETAANGASVAVSYLFEVPVGAKSVELRYGNLEAPAIFLIPFAG